MRATALDGKQGSYTFGRVKLIEGVFALEQKREIIRKVTDSMISIEGESTRRVSFVTTEETKSGDLEDRRAGDDSGGC